MKNLKNFCAAISTDFAKELDELAAKFNLKTKTQLLEFLAANVAIDAPKTLRAQNIPYQLECYITAALRGTAAITKKAADLFVRSSTGGGRINAKTIDSVLCLYLDEIKEHAAAHDYTHDKSGQPYQRHTDFLAGLEAAFIELNKPKEKTKQGRKPKKNA